MTALFLATLAVTGTLAAPNDPRYPIAIPGGPLAASIARLSNATGADIGLTGAGLEVVMTSPIAGRLTVGEALDRMLRGHGLRAQRLPANGWRIEPLPPRPPRSPPPHPATASGLASAAILVNASKRRTSLARFAGAVGIVDITDRGADPAAASSDAVVERSAVLSSTARGAGRNKLFIRGIADSGFGGTSQVTTAQYLDDARLTYNMPDPGLILFDVRSVEVLEGPQGTLYGAGALGGVVRVVTETPDPRGVAGTVVAGVALTSHGAPSDDAAAMINLPLVGGRMALRAVGYALSDGGYIDDPTHQRRDINRVVTRGGRLALRWQPDPDWTVDVRAVGQDIDGRDSQWAGGSPRPLVRAGQLPQPYRSGFLLGDVTITHDSGATRLVSVTAATRQKLIENYDANDAHAILDQFVSLYRERSVTRLLTHETRLSHSAANGSGWLVGVGLLSNHGAIDRDRTSSLLPSAPSQRLIDTAFEATLFGQASLRLPLGLIATGGARLGHSHLGDSASRFDDLFTVYRLTDAATSRSDHRTRTRFMPSAALAFSPRHDLFLFVRYDQAFRPGGLAVGNGGIERFESDRLASVEAGARLGDSSARAGLSVILAHTSWRHVQADLVTENGLPTTTNIGDATISTLELAGHWRPSHSLGIDATFFANRNKLRTDDFDVIMVPQANVPNVANFGASAGAVWEHPLGGAQLTLDGRVRYVGKSRLGVGPVLGVAHGNYCDGEIVARWGSAHRGISLRLTNPFDSTANRFALGTPFRLFMPQANPLRPRTLRLGLDARF